MRWEVWRILKIIFQQFSIDNIRMGQSGVCLSLWSLTIHTALSATLSLLELVNQSSLTHIWTVINHLAFPKNSFNMFVRMWKARAKQTINDCHIASHLLHASLVVELNAQIQNADENGILMIKREKFGKYFIFSLLGFWDLIYYTIENSISIIVALLEL